MMRTTTIKRDEWARGGKGGNSRLLNEYKNLCCLGFDMRACGLADDEISGEAFPSELTELPAEGRTWTKNASNRDWTDLITRLPEHLEDYLGDRPPGNFKLEDLATTVNDEMDLPEPDRERLIREIFRVAGRRVRFVGRGFPE